MPLIVTALELPPFADSSALSVSAKVADGFKLFTAATPPDTIAVAGEVPAMVFQQSKLFPSEHKVGSAYWLFVLVSPPMAKSFTWLLKLE
jgi:hypothetical protein